MDVEIDLGRHRGRILNELRTKRTDLDRNSLREFLPDIRSALLAYSQSKERQERADRPADVAQQLDRVAQAAGDLKRALDDLDDTARDTLDQQLLVSGGWAYVDMPPADAFTARGRKWYACWLEEAADSFEPTGPRADEASTMLVVILARVWIAARGELPGSTRRGPFWRFVHACLAVVEDDPTVPTSKIDDVVRHHRSRSSEDAE